MNAPRLLTPALLLIAATAAAAPRGHMVFFQLAEPSVANRKELVAKCHEHLTGHEGTVYYSVGVAPGEPAASDKPGAFDVALHLVFDGPAALEKYDKNPRHQKFIKEAKSLWSGVQVFDSDLTPTPAGAAAPPR